MHNYRQGVNSVSIVGRLSTLQSVHYLRLHCIFLYITLPICFYSCSSMFAVWGSRTEGGSLYSARNLDWNKDTGVNKHKVVMIVVPNDGGIPSATLGFACLYGTLAGMSAKGKGDTQLQVSCKITKTVK